jgi:hypothetical protein
MEVKKDLIKRHGRLFLVNEYPDPTLELKYLSKDGEEGFPEILKQSFALN